MTCQNKGSKAVLNRLQNVWKEQYAEKYPTLQIIASDCMGDCEQGPILKVNDSMLIRLADQSTAEQLLKDPETVLGQVMHVLEKDRDTFERIINGELY